MALDVARLLEGALRIPSVHPDEKEVAQYLVDAVGPHAGEAYVDEAGNAVARLGSGPLRVVFLGHLDTVPGAVPVRIEGERLYGRGAVDAKGPLCAAFAAASRLAPRTLERLELTVIGAAGEETPSSPGARHVLRTLGRPHLLIVGEPSGWDGITLGYKGKLGLNLQAVRENFHSAAPEATAAEVVVGVWNDVTAWRERFNEGREKVFDQVQISLQGIESFADGLQQCCRATLGLRLPLDLGPDEARSHLQGLLPAGVSGTFSGGQPAYRGERDSALTRAFRSAIREAGGVPRLKLKTGTSDLNLVGPVWRVPAVAYGPGDSSLDHTPDEHVHIAELERSVAILQRVFERLAG